MFVATPCCSNLTAISLGRGSSKASHTSCKKSEALKNEEITLLLTRGEICFDCKSRAVLCMGGMVYHGYELIMPSSLQVVYI